MSLPRQLLVLIGAMAAFLALFYAFSPVMLPFVAGMGLAFALDPLAHSLERRGFSRFAATLAILVLFAIVFIIVLVTLVPVLVQQLVDLIVNLPMTVEKLQVLAEPLLDTRMARLLGIDADTIRASIGGFLSGTAGWLTGMLGSLLAGGRSLVGVVSLLLVTPVVAFYMLYDWDRMLASVDSWLPRDNAPTLRALAHEIAHAISGFVRGQGLICLVLASWYGIGLAMVGLNFGLVIGFGAGLLSFIPFIGTISGFVVAMIVALGQLGTDWVMIAATAGVFLTGQFFEGNILSPRLVGNRVGLHPVWLMFALFTFGYTLDFLGLLIAVPFAATLGVICRFALKRYLESPYYRGWSTAPAASAKPVPTKDEVGS